MAKPTVSTEWAQDAAALKIVPTSGQRQFGWSTSDNTVTGNPVKPNLQNQNGWQNNVHQWIAWLAAQFPDGTAFEKVPRWTYIRSASSVVDDISTNGTNLIISKAAGAAGGSEVFEASNQFAPAFGGLYHQMMVDFGNGFSWRFIDGAGDEWIVKPLRADPTGNRTSLQGQGGGNYEMIIFPTNANSHQIYRNDVEVADFNGFTASGSSPQFQACIYSPMQLSPDGSETTKNYHLLGINERRYLSIVGPDHSIIQTAVPLFCPLRLEGGEHYRVKMSSYAYAANDNTQATLHSTTSSGDSPSSANRLATTYSNATGGALTPCVVDQVVAPKTDGSVFQLNCSAGTITFQTDFRTAASFSFWEGETWPVIEFETLYPKTYSLLT